MKNIFTITLLISIQFMFSQENFISKAKVEYELIVNLKKSKGVLYFNDNYSKFDYQLLYDKKEKTEKVIISDDNNINVQIKIKDTLKYFIYFNKKDDELIYSSKGFKNNKLVAIKEKMPIIKWLIINEFKTIDGIQCQKATSKFRGRNYTAWFSKEIPSYFGPMKFGQLPGLILEIYDDKKEVIINATKITYPKVQKIITKSNYKILSKETYLKNRNDYLKNLKEKINRISTRIDGNVKKIKIKINNNGIELNDEN